MAVGHDPPRDVEAESGALADVLRREERLERAGLHVGWHAGAVVGDLDHHELRFGARRDADRAIAVDSVDGVGDQVRPDLAELGRDGFDLWPVSATVRDESGRELYTIEVVDYTSRPLPEEQELAIPSNFARVEPTLPVLR